MTMTLLSIDSIVIPYRFSDVEGFERSGPTTDD